MCCCQRMGARGRRTHCGTRGTVWVSELGVPISRGRDVTGFAQDDTGVDVALSEGQSRDIL